MFPGVFGVGAETGGLGVASVATGLVNDACEHTSLFSIHSQVYTEHIGLSVWVLHHGCH